MRPNLEKGADSVVMLSVTLLMTVTSDGLEGTSLEDMLGNGRCFGVVGTSEFNVLVLAFILTSM